MTPVRAVEELGALPAGAVVLTASPRIVPPVLLWMSAYTDANGHWWMSGLDDLFLAADVLFENPEVVRLLHHPAWQRAQQPGAVNRG